MFNRQDNQGHEIGYSDLSPTRKDYISFPHVHEEGLESFQDQVQFALRSVFRKAFEAMANVKEVVIVTPYLAQFQRPTHTDFPEGARHSR
ncbi:hypothetical protein CC86DRAFT_62755 [Ophiobolus disseminans]|uniref:Uncharacterized protein n=1 Tax=Ophiobolus disseminans TaxID=1469910 RepID=A0A6A6ZUJ6_9PLEO|nr:hypothetical protein CC86DRAFT_62755 [Ophiobolus disseminans]